MSDAIITVRVSKELREELKKYGVRVSEVVRKALEEELRRIKLKKLQEAAVKLGDFFSKIPDEEIIEGIRRVRMER